MLDPGDLCGHSGQKTRARPEPARTGRGPSPERYRRSLRPRLTARVTATAAANGKRERSAAPRGTCTLHGNLGYVRPESRQSRIEAGPPRLLPIMLPSRWTTPVQCGQLWNVGPAHGPRRTVLDEVPTPTDQMVSGPSRGFGLAFLAGAPAPDPGPRELRPLCNHPARASAPPFADPA